MRLVSAHLPINTYINTSELYNGIQSFKIIIVLDFGKIFIACILIFGMTVIVLICFDILPDGKIFQYEWK